MQGLRLFRGNGWTIRRGTLCGGKKGRKEAVLFNDCSPDNTYGLIILVELWRMALDITITEGCEAFRVAKQLIFTKRMRAAWQAFDKSLSARPGAEMLHRLRQEAFFPVATSLLIHLVDLCFIALREPACKYRHHIEDVGFPVKAMYMHHHKSTIILQKLYYYDTAINQPCQIYGSMVPDRRFSVMSIRRLLR